MSLLLARLAVPILMMPLNNSLNAQSDPKTLRVNENRDSKATFGLRVTEKVKGCILISREGWLHFNLERGIRGKQMQHFGTKRKSFVILREGMEKHKCCVFCENFLSFGFIILHPWYCCFLCSHFCLLVWHLSACVSFVVSSKVNFFSCPWKKKKPTLIFLFLFQIFIISYIVLFPFVPSQNDSMLGSPFFFLKSS